MTAQPVSGVAPLVRLVDREPSPRWLSPSSRLDALVDVLVADHGGAALVVDASGRVVSHAWEAAPPEVLVDCLVERSVAPLTRGLRQPRTVSADGHLRGVAYRHAQVGACLEIPLGTSSGDLGAVWFVGQDLRWDEATIQAAVRSAASVACTALAAADGDPDPSGLLARDLLAGRVPRRVDLRPGLRATAVVLEVRGMSQAELPLVLQQVVTSLRLGGGPDDDQHVLWERGRAYVVLLAPEERSAVETRALVERIVARAVRAVGGELRVAVGPAWVALEDVPGARDVADQLLDLLPAHLSCGFADELGAEVFLDGVKRRLAGLDYSGRDPLRALVEHDGRKGTQLVRSLKTWLDRFGDTQATAEALGVHPNTLRYRVERALAISGVDASNPAQRLALHLRLWCADESSSREAEACGA